MFLITLRSFLTVLIVSLLAGTSAWAQHSATADQIVGRWWFPAKRSSLEVYRVGSRYFARLDKQNPHSMKQYGNVKNQVVLTDMEYKGSEWSGGHMIHPNSGMRFNAVAVMRDPQTMVITVYKGAKFLSRDFIFTRATDAAASR